MDPVSDPARPGPLIDSAIAPATTAPVAIRTIDRAPGDPLENFNRKMFSAFQKTDRKFIRPAAMAYKHVVPKLVRSGLRNALSNLNEPIVFLNDLLQLKPGRAVKTLVRFLANSTIGIGGLVDVAKTPAVRLTHHDNGFGNTLAYYGVGPGPYLFLPFVGPTTLRDLIGGQGDGFVLPVAVGKPFDRWQFQVPRGIVSALDQRAESDADMKALLDGAIDPYATLRSVYLQNRAGEIRALHSGATAQGENPLEDPLSDPAGGAASPLADPLNDPAAAPPAPSAPPGADKTDPANPLNDPLSDPAASTPAPANNP
ncbi:MAG: VacJ family lipoprotein [Pseudomonadota bacterium]|jgi:phospholipid-binding lipoprotein MlaA|uniref:Surface lipoprotein n=1 Tax=hydrothermal vent metagenome TaxID=652676 RepID=A0A170PPD8_9ZZZZ